LITINLDDLSMVWRSRWSGHLQETLPFMVGMASPDAREAG